MQKPVILSIGLSGGSTFLKVGAFARPGETIVADTVCSEPGGKAFNQAIAAARLHAEVHLLSAVGHDENGRLCRERLSLEGVTAHFFVKPGIATAYAVIMTNASGENTVTVFPGASTYLTGTDVASVEPLFRRADYLLLQCEITQEAFHAAFTLAEKHGVRVLFDPAPIKPFAKAYLRRATVATPNYEEACELLSCPRGASDAELAEASHIAGTPVLVTLGARGVLLCQNGKFRVIPAPIVPVVDTTGAGDAFAAAVAVRLAEGASLETAAAFAVRCAVRSVQYPMALEGLGRGDALSPSPPPA